MAHRLFDRIARLARADAHGVVAALEDRTLLLEQHLREAELALAAERARAEALGDRDARLLRAFEAERARAARLDEDVALALGGGKDELARFALRRLLASRKSAHALEAERAAGAAEAAQLAGRIASHERGLDELREKVRAHRARAAVRSAADEGAPASCAVGVADEEVELELLRRRGAAESAS